MSKNVFRLSEAQHQAYKARRSVQCARADGMTRVQVGAVPKRILETADWTPPPAKVDPSPCNAGEGRGSKYRNVKTNGYDSTKEARRAFVLHLMQEAGEISGLVEQARFPIRVNGLLICTYVCDFGYTLTLTGKRVVEDVKSPVTAARSDYRMKKRLMKAVFNVDIQEV